MKRIEFSIEYDGGSGGYYGVYRGVEFDIEIPGSNKSCYKTLSQSVKKVRQIMNKLEPGKKIYFSSKHTPISNSLEVFNYENKKRVVNNNNS